MNHTRDDRENAAKIDDLLELTASEMQRLKVPGVAWGLVSGDETFTAGLGVTSLENPLPVNSETLFQIGSTTKTITSTAIFRLIEQGKLTLDDPVQTHIPSFKVQDEDVTANVTVRHLLNHTSGWMGDYFTDTGEGDDALERFVEKMSDLQQLTPLGAIYTYNNAAFNVAGRIIELITGKTYEDAIQEMVLNPLQMDNSFFFPGEVMLRRFVVGYNLKDEKPVLAEPWTMHRGENPCGGLISDVDDQLKYAHFHMGNGKNTRGEQLLSAKSLQLMQTPGVLAGGDGRIGLNWFIEDIDGVRFVGHGGSTNGQQSAFWMAPAEKLAFTVLTNLDMGTVLHESLTRWVREHFLGVIEAKPEALPLSADALSEFTGRYMLQPTGDIFEFSVQGGRLLLKHTLGDYSSIMDTPPDPLPRMKAVLFDTDRLVFLDEPYDGMKGEFLRDEHGKIAWLRVGGRVLARQK
jgi:CubicO group peptidase (beta-lactamase class C family)